MSATLRHWQTLIDRERAAHGVLRPVRVRRLTSVECSRADRKLSADRTLEVRAIYYPDDAEHEIAVRADVLASPTIATVHTLLHELAHCLQAERFPSAAAWRRAYEAAGRYRENSFEREAR